MSVQNSVAQGGGQLQLSTVQRQGQGGGAASGWSGAQTQGPAPCCIVGAGTLLQGRAPSSFRMASIRRGPPQKKHCSIGSPSCPDADAVS